MRAINSYDLLYLEIVLEHNPRVDFVLTLFFLPDSRSDSGQLATLAPGGVASKEQSNECNEETHGK